MRTNGEVLDWRLSADLIPTKSAEDSQKLNRVINMLSSLQGIAWANTAIGAANMALTVMNFTVINSKLNGLAQQITSAVADLKREMKAIQLEDIVNVINNCAMI